MAASPPWATSRPHLRGLVPAVQAGLPAGLWLLGAARVAPGWNPRHAVARHYAYFAADSGQDLARMRAAAQAFLGVHDMHHFARMEPHRAPRREVTRFDVAREEGWRFDVAGPSFLWNQVRRMVGAVLAVGAGEAAVEDVSRALSGGPRHAAFQVAGPEGLLLIAVDYDGLTWDDEAGRLGRRAVQRPMQEARVRLELLRRLGGA
jgi:tRNA pseudouridine(38-40) synthase